MKALVTGFHMLYRLSPDSKYPWSGENTGPIEIPVLNIPLLDDEGRDQKSAGRDVPQAWWY